MFNLNIFVFICGVFSINVKASTLDELKTKYVELILECSENFPISAEDMIQLKQKTMPNSEPIKCLFACVYKKAGMMNKQGELWIEGVNEMTRKYLSDDPAKIKKSEQFTQACKSVNDIAVSDGDRGCDRAALIFNCTVEKSPYFDLL